MATPKHFKVANFDHEPGELNLHCIATIEWGEPAEWDEDRAPIPEAAEKNAIYAILRDHGRQSDKGRIVYIGMTTTLPTRFNRHPAAEKIRAIRGQTRLSVGRVSFKGARAGWAKENPKPALEQIEHLLLWALWPTLVNIKKLESLPLFKGANSGNALPWIIRSEGYRFHGRMPREIVYPWMIIKPGRDRSARQAQVMA